MIAFGTYGVPMKAMQAIDPDPLVFQTYMTTMVFATSWVILLLPGDAPEIVLTPWGIVSALFWIPGGLAVIYAVQNAGLAVAIGVGNSFIVLVSFTWGIFIFGEKVQSELWACIAVLVMICGICGMSYFSAASNTPSTSAPSPAKQYAALDQQEEEATNGFAYDDDYNEQEEDASDDDSFLENGENSKGYHQVVSLQHGDDDSSEDDDDNVVIKTSNMESLEIEGVEQEALTTTTTCCGVTLSPRALGILAAVFQGAWGGSIMVPMHFAG
jgi:hypothetical protein